jgi:magnesium transporter
MITVFRWNAATQQGEWLEPEALRRSGHLPDGAQDVWWVNLDHPDPREESLVFHDFMSIHALTLEDITKPRREPDVPVHLPKVEEFPDYLFVIVNALFDTEQPFSRHHGARQLSAILTENVLITHHYDSLPSIVQLRQYLLKHDSQAARGPDYLFHIILDAMVDEFAPLLDQLTDRLDSIENEVFGKPTPRLLADMLEVKQAVVHLRKTLILEREVLARLTRGEFSLIDEREIAYYRNVYDHLVRYSELIESSREMVSDLMQSHLAAASNRLNEVMKALTMISTIVLPMSLIAGVYGMNFKGWFPELDWHYGYPFALAVMCMTGLGTALLFRWRKWI